MPPKAPPPMKFGGLVMMREVATHPDALPSQVVGNFRGASLNEKHLTKEVNKWQTKKFVSV